MSRGNSPRTLRAFGFKEPPKGFIEDASDQIIKKKGKRGGTFELKQETIKLFNRNIEAYIKTLGAKNLVPMMQQNAERIIVPRVRRAIKKGKDRRSVKGHLLGDRWYTWKGARKFRIKTGNMEKSYQVLKHGKFKKFENVVFIGPKAFYGRGANAKLYGRNPKNTNAFYAPAKEAKDPQILPAFRSVRKKYLLANAVKITSLMKG